MVADALELEGWEVFHLCANNPTESIVSMVHETGAGLVGLSVSMPYHYSAARETIQRLTVRGEGQPSPHHAGRIGDQPD